MLRSVLSNTQSVHLHVPSLPGLETTTINTTTESLAPRPSPTRLFPHNPSLESLEHHVTMERMLRPAHSQTPSPTRLFPHNPSLESLEHHVTMERMLRPAHSQTQRESAKWPNVTARDGCTTSVTLDLTVRLTRRILFSDLTVLPLVTKLFIFLHGTCRNLICRRHRIKSIL
ncbi:hypothetical protein BCR33DRAFT_403221 [Rhizoclosmatium globosum]|uniref:Uncharacterized protein n=1 Tax=Rhizoclosmatium globosum TaxID=329046 RepID=A0A1Y2CY55_9FUNG|nr:hypothetical protein BCR33DRAFT_403221 [Rhizoclosmatium globosum]|eukprot:ORY51950.1 hypothetical protein BCR33DRAFT_403221 [Rhizoclosmatium globosum]